ncbi:hypothetical protein PQR75_45470 [Paraburkholderia fungorum]|uniref:hypothetical protein n=1 Tax=Paraburkholderia fungorum TaxID=134537 RepID=UPI0038B72FAD
MTNVVELRPAAPSAGSAEAEQIAKAERRLRERYGFGESELREAIKPLFRLMHSHGVASIGIERDGAKLMVKVDGKAV